MFKIPDVFEIDKPKSAWVRPEPNIDNADQQKHVCGIELAKYPAFKAACEIFGEDTNTAVWVAQNWINDPIVIAAKDKYLEAANVSQTLLDKDQLARKLLTMAEEKNANNTFYLLDGKDRLAALKLYAEVRGYTGTKIDPSNTTFIHNQMTIKVVSPEPKEPKIKTIDNNEEIQNTNSISPLKLKLVG